MPARGPLASNRTVRSLALLQKSATTARTMNLLAVWGRHGEEPGYSQNKLFENPLLNRCILAKHRLRANELSYFSDGRGSATKVILPIDISNLATGGRSFFVGQRGYSDCLEEISVKPQSRDAGLLEIIDGLPSLDPFLMRDRLIKEGFTPDRCYFDLTEADASRMFEFVRQELTPMIGMTFEDGDRRLTEKSTRLATKILADASAAELEPLRLGMGMSTADFAEGVFCWKGFIYYKWTLTDLLPKVRPVSDEIAQVRASGSVDMEDRVYITEMKRRLTRAIARSCDTVRTTLKIYDDAYAEFTREGNPASFREFLLKAPELFHELGERLGALNHIVSFWRFRFPQGASVRVTADELTDLLGDFEVSLGAEPVSSNLI